MESQLRHFRTTWRYDEEEIYFRKQEKVKRREGHGWVEGITHNCYPGDQSECKQHQLYINKCLYLTKHRWSLPKPTHVISVPLLKPSITGSCV